METTLEKCERIDKEVCAEFETIDKTKVQEILTSLQTIPQDEISTKDDKLDFNKLFARNDIKQAITKLKKLGVTRKWLHEHFFCAWVALGSKFN